MSLVLITGASSGLGEAAARRFAKEGAQVVLVARSADKLKTLRDEIGTSAVAAPCDASDPAAVEKLAKMVLDKHGVPDVIINSAGAGQWKTVPDTTPDEVVTMMQAPYYAAFFVTRAFLPAMLERQSGVIIHVGSPACLVAWPSSAGYTAARGALKGFHEALAQDLAGTGVTSCHVMFGQVDSPYFDNNAVTDDQLPKLGKTMPTLSVEQCATHLAKLAGSPKHESIYPFMLKLNAEFARLFPGISRRLARL